MNIPTNLQDTLNYCSLAVSQLVRQCLRVIPNEYQLIVVAADEINLLDSKLIKSSDTLLKSCIGAGYTLSRHKDAQCLLLLHKNHLIGCSLYSDRQLISFATKKAFKGAGTLLYGLSLMIESCLYYEANMYAEGFYQKMGAKCISSSHQWYQDSSGLLRIFQQLNTYLDVFRQKSGEYLRYRYYSSLSRHGLLHFKHPSISSKKKVLPHGNSGVKEGEHSELIEEDQMQFVMDEIYPMEIKVLGLASENYR